MYTDVVLNLTKYLLSYHGTELDRGCHHRRADCCVELKLIPCYCFELVRVKCN